MREIWKLMWEPKTDNVSLMMIIVDKNLMEIRNSPKHLWTFLRKTLTVLPKIVKRLGKQKNSPYLTKNIPMQCLHMTETIQCKTYI